MSAIIIPLDRIFDATDMSPQRIADEVRLRGWQSFEIDVQRALFGDGKVIISRVSRRALIRGQR